MARGHPASAFVLLRELAVAAGCLADGALEGAGEGEIAVGESYERLVAATAIGGYYCVYHPTMTATLEAQEPLGMDR